jgi:putative ABC transport system substrate-binding protein
MTRREFITLLGGAAAWPLAARAQQGEQVKRIGVLMANAKADPLVQVRIQEFRQGLREFGLVEGQNVAIEYRFAEARYERLPALAADLVQRRVAVIVTGPRAQDAAKAATATIPIVFVMGADPVRTGLVASLNRPGGNLTGISLLSVDMLAKRFGLLHDVVPQADVVGVLLDSTYSTSETFQLEEMQAAANSVGRTIRVASAGSESEIDTAFALLAREPVGAITLAASSFFVSLRGRIVELAARHRIPAIYELREFAEAGGLMSYGSIIADAYRQAGTYTGRILKGENPADLPVMLPTRFEFVINLKTVRALGLTVPPGILAIADAVIE